MEGKLNDLTQKKSVLDDLNRIISVFFLFVKFSRFLQEKLAETIDRLQQQQQHVHIQSTADYTNDAEHDRYDHERMHQTIDELIEQAALKTRSAVR
jgi:hypothetical protein